MSEEWIYKHIFIHKYLQIAIIKKKFKDIQKLHKCPYILVEYRLFGKAWKQVGFLR